MICHACNGSGKMSAEQKADYEVENDEMPHTDICPACNGEGEGESPEPDPMDLAKADKERRMGW